MAPAVAMLCERPAERPPAATHHHAGACSRCGPETTEALPKQGVCRWCAVRVSNPGPAD